jgi:hypothetical protein
MRRGIIQFICLWAIVLSASRVMYGVEFAGGRGEPNDPYLIATAEQLLGADFTLPGVYFRLCQDIDLYGRGVYLALSGPIWMVGDIGFCV